MHERFAADYERKIVQLAENRIETGNYEIFDNKARVVTRKKLKRVAEENRSLDENCLILVNAEGKTIAVTREFEMTLRNALQVGK